MNAIDEAVYLSDENNWSGALRIWRDLAERGSVWSMIEIGRCYEYGRGVKRDPIEADNWYFRAFVGGSQVAMLKCAKAAAARRDFARCDEILQQGVDQRWAPAQFWLAWYRYKRSDDAATYRAIRPLLEAAAKSGHPAAQLVLANFMVRGKLGLWNVPRGVKLTIQWARQASEEHSRRTTENSVMRRELND